VVHCLAVLVRSMSSPTLVHIGLGAASQQAYIEIAPGKNFAARLDWQSELGAIWWDMRVACKRTSFLWSPYVIRQTIIFLPCDFFLSSFYLLFFIPRLISAAVDWMSTILLHMAWP